MDTKNNNVSNKSHSYVKIVEIYNLPGYDAM